MVLVLIGRLGTVPYGVSVTRGLFVFNLLPGGCRGSKDKYGKG